MLFIKGQHINIIYNPFSSILYPITYCNNVQYVGVPILYKHDPAIKSFYIRNGINGDLYCYIFTYYASYTYNCIMLMHIIVFTLTCRYTHNNIYYIVYGKALNVNRQILIWYIYYLYLPVTHIIISHNRYL